MALQDLLQLMGGEVDDPDEETFLLFSQLLPSQNLGFIDAKATDLDVRISGKELNIQQSPGLLSSNRGGGTTGAVVWKITPLFAGWAAGKDNILFKTGVLNQASKVLELGCGISGILAIVLAPKIGRYIATDQDYVFKLLKPNIENNVFRQKASVRGKRGGKVTVASGSGTSISNIEVIALDWELSSVSNLSALIGAGPDRKPHTLDVVFACDCIYNEALVHPFVQTCAEICRLANPALTDKVTACIIAQQLRSDLVFEAWLSAFHKIFKVWRLPDELLMDGLRQGSGFVVHIGVLRDPMYDGIAVSQQSPSG